MYTGQEQTDTGSHEAESEKLKRNDIPAEYFIKEAGNESVLPSKTFLKLTQPFRVRDVSYGRDIDIFCVGWDASGSGEISVYGVGTYEQADGKAVIFLTPQGDFGGGDWRPVSAAPWMFDWLGKNYSKIIPEGRRDEYDFYQNLGSNKG